VLEALTKQLTARQPLTPEQVRAAVTTLVDEAVATDAKAGFLTALAGKGETADEIAAFARELRERAVAPPLDAETRARDILDVCGTGGDRLGTFNISTAVALLVAAAGVTVAKHGNRAVTSQAGSADVLEALGVRIDLTPAQAARSLREHGFAFFFAPAFHPAFKHIAPARKACAARGQRTIFNFLGPLLNPARPTAQLIGVPQPELCEPIARVLQSLGARRGMVVSGQVAAKERASLVAGARAPSAAAAVGAWLDELSTLGENTVAEFYQDRGFALSSLSPENFPVQAATLDDLRGGDKEANAETIRRLLRGEERGPKRDAVLLNAGAALLVAGRARTVTEGWALAADLIASGQARAKLEALVAARFD
jgi:anthranilate phosphoribosyltransferase